jgi:hypothetical protein
MTNTVASGNLRAVNPVQAETLRNLLSKMRAGFSSAAAKNAVETAPLLPPANINTGPGNAVRANATTYPRGYVFTNAAGTHQFVVRLGGATAGAEPATVTNPIVTATPYNMGDIADGAATLTWMGPVRVTTANPLAPVVSSGAKPAQLSVANNFGPAVNYGTPFTNIFQFAGGTGAIQGNPNNFLTYALGVALAPGGGSSQIDPTSSTGFGAQANSVTFMTDASLLALDLTTGAQGSGLSTATALYIEVDGVRLCDGQIMALAALGAGVGFILLDWRSNGGRKLRKIRLSVNDLSTGQHNYGRFYTQPQDIVQFPSNPNRYRIAMVGDSTGSGSSSSNYLASYDRATIMANLIGCDDCANLGAGSTGYLAAASPQIPYLARLRDLIKLQPDVVYVCNNFNDSGFSSAQRVTAINLYLATVRATLPNALILVGGTIGGVSPTNNAVLEADMATSVANFNDGACFFLPEATDVPQWETGTGNLNGTNGTGNNDIYKGPTDTVHPSTLGIQYLAQRDANAIRNFVNSINTVGV